MSGEKVYFNGILLDYERDIIGGNILKIIADHSNKTYYDEKNKPITNIRSLQFLILDIRNLYTNYHYADIHKYGHENGRHIVETRYVNWIEICIKLLEVENLSEYYVKNVLSLLNNRYTNWENKVFDRRLTEECYQSLDKFHKLVMNYFDINPSLTSPNTKRYYLELLHFFFLEEDNDKKRLFNIIDMDFDNFFRNQSNYYLLFIKLLRNLIYIDDASLSDDLFAIFRNRTDHWYNKTIAYMEHIKMICALVKMPEALNSKYIFTERLGKHIEKIVKYYDSVEKINHLPFVFKMRRRLTVMDDILHIRNVLEKNNIYIFSEPFDFDTFSFYLEKHDVDIDVFDYMYEKNPDFHLNQNKKKSYLYTVANIIKQKHIKDGMLIKHHNSYYDSREGEMYSSHDEYYYFEKDKEYKKHIEMLEYMCLNGAKFLVGEMKKLGKKNSVAKIIRRMRKHRKLVLYERYEELDNYFKEIDTNNTYDVNISYYISKMIPIDISVNM